MTRFTPNPKYMLEKNDSIKKEMLTPEGEKRILDAMRELTVIGMQMGRVDDSFFKEKFGFEEPPIPENAGPDYTPPVLRAHSHSQPTMALACLKTTERAGKICKRYS